jgi:pimeloyl-ACP methyl ester carboxylesterase
MRHRSIILVSVTRTRRRAAARVLAVALLIMTMVPAWSADYAPEQISSCAEAPSVIASLKQQVVATRVGPMGYYRFGSGRPLLLITGYRATVSEWNSTFIAALAAHRDVIMVDNPGVGRSRSDHPPETMEGMSDSISDFIDAMHLGRVDVVGWSMGGMVAQQLAIDHPYQVSSMVLLSTTPPGSGAAPVSSAVNAVLSGEGASPFTSIMDTLFPPDAAARAIRCFRAEMFQPDDYGRVAVDARVANAQTQAMDAWWRDNGAATAIGHTAVRALVVVGDQDAVLLPHNAYVLADLLPHAALQVVGGGGHALMYQEPRRLAEVVLRFVDAKP